MLFSLIFCLKHNIIFQFLTGDKKGLCNDPNSQQTREAKMAKILKKPRWEENGWKLFKGNQNGRYVSFTLAGHKSGGWRFYKMLTSPYKIQITFKISN